ncbi:11079_t:CDS:10 [Paraglomus brasilianum]|uniref:11079_t:CDS:1 n=1 Tax=Paraglomus brasilianum TaxID=144538 RepID=A0A9N8ZVK0_9GLOM|nr:11079_t:CDS:10 [Paraglomus brasilianum]
MASLEHKINMKHDNEKAFTPNPPVESGLRPEPYYEKRLSPIGARIRRVLLAAVAKEKDLLMWIQSRRHPWLDLYFVYSSNLGAHTFFMVCLPLLFWFGYAQLGRGLTTMLAAGVFFSGFLKDIFCLPRPPSPPIRRLTMSNSHQLEYGFPSTHSVNAVSVTVYFIAFILPVADLEYETKIISIAAFSIYCLSVVIGRVYCGMHSFTDITGGIVMGVTLSWLQWAWQQDLDDFVLDGSWMAPMIMSSVILFLIYIFPEPIDNCPCFDDAFAFAGVMMGLTSGSWRFARSKFSHIGYGRGNVPYEYEIVGPVVTITRILIGIAILFLWRYVMKKLCYITLPPLYRALNLPCCKNNLSASKCKTHMVPSVFDLPRTTKEFDVHSTADPYEYLDAEKEKEQGLNRRQNKSESNGTIDGNSHVKYFAEKLEKGLFNNVTTIRYDVDVVTKLIVYSGIGYLAVDTIPVLFESTGLGVGIATAL